MVVVLTAREKWLLCEAIEVFRDEHGTPRDQASLETLLDKLGVRDAPYPEAD